MKRNICIAIVLLVAALALISCKVEQKCGPPCPHPIENGWVVTEEKVDRKNNGIINTITTYEYNSFGDIIKTITEYKDDGVHEIKIQEYEYDADNRPVKYLRDYTSDGKLDDVFFVSYDTKGNVSKVEVDRDNDGTVDGGEYYTYDDQCRVIQKENTIFFSKMLYEYRYDLQGFLYEKVYKSDGADGNSIRLYYNERGLLSRAELNIEGMDKMDVFSYEYDEIGLPVKISFDFKNDGTADLVRYYSWDKMENIPDRWYFRDYCPEYY